MQTVGEFREAVKNARQIRVRLKLSHGQEWDPLLPKDHALMAVKDLPDNADLPARGNDLCFAYWSAPGELTLNS